MGFAPPKEIDLTNACIQYLLMQGAYVWRQNNGAMKVGKYFVKFVHLPNDDTECISDIVGTLADGRSVAIETKLPNVEKANRLKDKVRLAKQMAFLDQIKRRGGVAGVVHSIDELQQLLDAAGDTSKPQSGRRVIE